MSTYGLGAEWWEGLISLGGKVVDQVGAGYVETEETKQARIKAAATSPGSGGTIPTSAWDTMSKPLMIGAAALAGLVLIMALTKR
jgi:hypothetical protein